jgi:signal transduction histidine kinase
LRLLVESIDDGVATGTTRDRYLREIRTHVDVLSGLIDDLFELSRIEAGDIAWTMRQVELGGLIGDTVAALRAPAEQKGISLEAEAPTSAVVAEADAEKVQRVLFNLIQNAIRHTPADGSVTVRARAAGGDVEVEVADDGEGIAAADGARVFEAFYRGDAARGEDGAGLGLAISRAIVEAHGGRIWLEDGHPGTRVRFTLRAA